MASVINIYNMALSRIGVTQRVASLTEETENRRVCSLWYEQCRDTVLRAHPWGFAKTVQALALLPESPPPGWALAYAYPTDCVLARQITTSAGARLASLSPYGYEPMAMAYTNSRIPFDQQYSAYTSQRIIATDQSDAYLVYTSRVTDTLLFDSLFTNTLSWLLAKEAGAALRAETRLVTAAGQEYAAALHLASAMTQNERVPDIMPDSPSISVRG